MSLIKLGRARLCLTMPRHRELLLSIKTPALYDLFGSYALAAQNYDSLRSEQPRQEELMREYQGICLDLQAELFALLRQCELREQNWT